MTRLLLVLILTTCFSLAYAEDEAIYSFDDHITVNKDASIDVTEAITVYAKDIEIIHGLVRRLPLAYIDSYGLSRSTKYNITQIAVNNLKASYHSVIKDHVLSIYIGDKDQILSPGFYIYTIGYHVDNAVNFLKDADEFYWNVTGNSWDFPVKKASATIELPEGAVIAKNAAYTGTAGQRGTDYTATTLTKNSIKFETTSTLPTGSGFTVGILWQKGIVIQPTSVQLIMQQFGNNEQIVTFITLLSLIYFCYVWYLYGRDLRNKTIIPLYEPPADLTPEAMRYIINMGYDRKVFTSAIVNMAAKGYLTIKNDNGTFTLIKNNVSDDKLSAEEKVTAGQLFSGNSEFLLTNSNSKSMIKAQTFLKNQLKQAYLGVYFVTNIKYFCIGFLLSLTSVLFASDNANSSFQIFIPTLVFGVMFYASFNNARQLYSCRRYFAAFFSFVGALFVFAILIISTLTPDLSPFIILDLFILVIANLMFFKLLKAPTAAGRDIMDQIDGFRMYLSTTDRYRLNFMTPPDKTPELFEKYLPYAIALDVENEWGAQFEDVMRQAGIDPATYHPVWYVGTTSWSSRNSISAMPALLAAGISASVLASTVSSSSGGGGGGFSGGGGGGGGGGGW